MDFITSDTRKLYGQYLAASLASAIATSIYCFVDEVLHALAEKSDCVIVGRCADIVLRDLEPLNLFVYADMDTKIKRCQFKAAADEKLTDREMKLLIQNTERQQKYYYETIAENKWDVKENYHLCINTTSSEINGTEIKVQVPAIAAFCRAWFGGE